jgi:hypothetical protein
MMIIAQNQTLTDNQISNHAQGITVTQTSRTMDGRIARRESCDDKAGYYTYLYAY